MKKQDFKVLKTKDLYPFPDNPFHVVEDETLSELAESIKEFGIVTPIITRPKEDGNGYEVIAGQRRVRASELAGINTVPAFVLPLDRDRAIITLVDSNLQRENILPSERAFAYKMKSEAMKRQGFRTDLTSSQVVTKLRTDDKVAQGFGVGRMTVQRFIRLTELIPPILRMVDEGKIALTPAVELSFLIKCKEVKILKILPYAIGLTTAFFFLKKTQSTTDTLAILCGALCWGIEKILKRHMKKTMIAVMCFVICYIPVSMGLQWGITNISEAIGTQIVYPVDYEYASVRDLDDLTGTIHVYAAEREDMSQTSQRIRQKLLNSNSINGLFSGRLYHYSTYLSQMNLFGHTKRATVYGSNINSAHNGVLAYAHMYGVYIIVPYIMMFVGYFSRAVRYCKSAENRNYYACLPLIIYVVFFLENMMDNVDIPFHWIVWFVFILLGGFLFSMREEEKV